MTNESSGKRHTTICIGGMSCGSCELILEKKIASIPGVEHVDVNFRTGLAHICAQLDSLPDYDAVSDAITKAGYRIIPDHKDMPSSIPADKRKWIEIGGALIIIFAVYRLLQTFDILSLAPSTSGALSLGGIFLIGIVAGTSSCLAVTGGLLLALATKHNEMHRAETPWQRFKPLLHFNIGRVISYFVLGGMVGLLGQSVTLSPRISGYMNIIVSLIMLSLALSILGIVKKGNFPIRPPKKLTRWIAKLSESHHPAAPFSLGALTFFLPCGFTQSLQLVALASGSFLTGGTTMLIFALGTLPSLLGISAISSTASGTFSRLFLRFSGTLVLLLALFNLQSGIALIGIDLTRAFAWRGNQEQIAAPSVNGNLQEVFMAVTRFGYEPANPTIRSGIPVRWTINGDNATGCTNVMTIPSLNISKVLKKGSNIIEFTAPEKGQLAFMCSMGMVRGAFTVI